jgi:hypothetical protein
VRKQLPVILVAALSVGLASVPVRADTEGRIRKELEANYASIVKGFKKNDPAVWVGFLTPDFKLKLFNGAVQDRQWAADYVKNNARTFKVLKLSMTIKELIVEGQDATAVVEQKSSRAFNDEQGKSHQLDVGALQRETWTRTPSGWRLKSVQEWKVLYLLKDGKPMTQ